MNIYRPLNPTVYIVPKLDPLTGRVFISAGYLRSESSGASISAGTVRHMG